MDNTKTKQNKQSSTPLLCPLPPSSYLNNEIPRLDLTLSAMRGGGAEEEQ